MSGFLVKLSVLEKTNLKNYKLLKNVKKKDGFYVRSISSLMVLKNVILLKNILPFFKEFCLLLWKFC